MRRTFFLIAAALACAAAEQGVNCDVLVAGGSLASLAAALSAANSSAAVSVCFTDITDWPGGQATSSAVPAIDFGPENGSKGLPNPNLASVFQEALSTVQGSGDCWVSTKCFQPQQLVNGWISRKLASFANLRVYLNTAIVNSTRDPSTGVITSVTAVQRTPVAGTTGWERLTSQQLADWYSSSSSQYFSKQVITFNPKIVIDATEFGDILATSGVSIAQGIEAPYENSTTYIDYCGQGVTIAQYMTYGKVPAPSPDPIPQGSNAGLPFDTQNSTFARIWSYRRIVSVNNSNIETVTQGETSNQNWGGGNDLDNYYMFLDPTDWRNQPWAGGINTTVYSIAEQRAYGWYHFYKNYASAAVTPYLTLNNTQTGTDTYLPKMPYLRDTRRSGSGIQGFRLFYEPLKNCSDPGPIPNRTAEEPLAVHMAADGSCTTGYHFKDTIAIGMYFYADCHKMTPQSCPYPSYFSTGSPVLPYYLPFRALTNSDSPNLLVAGKTMAESFWANAGTRLHPEEWSSGTAAGIAAVFMAQNEWTSTQAYDNIDEIRTAIQNMGSPLEWTLP